MHVFPLFDAGDALMHNCTAWYAVAPLVSGARYSLAFFFDVDNPMIANVDYQDEEHNDVTQVPIKHKVKECHVGKIRYAPNIDLK